MSCKNYTVSYNNLKMVQVQDGNYSRYTTNIGWPPGNLPPVALTPRKRCGREGSNQIYFGCTAQMIILLPINWKLIKTVKPTKSP